MDLPVVRKGNVNECIKLIFQYSEMCRLVISSHINLVFNNIQLSFSANGLKYPEKNLEFFQIPIH